MIRPPVREAKTRLPELLRMVEVGGRVMVTRHGQPVALLTAAPGLSLTTAAGAVEALAEFGKGRRLGPSLSAPDLIREGHK